MQVITEKIFLASQSPRRLQLLKMIALDVEAVKLDFPEESIEFSNPENYVSKLAEMKMGIAILQNLNGIILTADTIVSLNNKILNKPENYSHAVAMLSELSGKTHEVYTAFSLSNKGETITGIEKTEVKFKNLLSSEIESYILTKSPFDKAGGYGIQDGWGAIFTEKINGCYYNVMGLPLSNLYQKVKELLKIGQV
ncbi:MAG: septum formation protein Maf [Ignavibacteriaceae bacterium]|nr:septum formation protein Maf [Ignavibacteriaceae bacterium]